MIKNIEERYLRDTPECGIELDQRHTVYELTLSRINILYKEREEEGEKGAAE